MRLGEVIYAMSDACYIVESEDVIDPNCIDKIAFGDIGNTPRIKLCFIAEDETAIEGLATHPIFFPLYKCEVYRIEADHDILRVWLNMSSVRKEIYESRFQPSFNKEGEE